jgi:predicted HTH domain antitoxin
MHTLTDDELKREPTQLLDDARRGQISVVTTDGQAVLMTVPLENGAPAPGALLDLAVTLYDREQISLGRAAEIAGLAYVDMMDELGRRGIATIRLRPGELERDLAGFGP